MSDEIEKLREFLRFAQKSVPVPIELHGCLNELEALYDIGRLQAENAELRSQLELAEKKGRLQACAEIVKDIRPSIDLAEELAWDAAREMEANGNKVDFYYETIADWRKERDETKA